MLIHKERLTGSTASGSLILTTVKFSGARLVQIYIKPAVASTVYDVEIRDTDSDDVWEELGIQGTLRRTLRTPISEQLTVAITNASADEAFVVKLGIEE